MLNVNSIYMLALTGLLLTSVSVNPTDLSEAGTNDLPQVIGCLLCNMILEMVTHRFENNLFLIIKRDKTKYLGNRVL